MIQLIIILFVLLLTFLISYLFFHRIREADRSESCNALLRIIAANMRENLAKLQRGDLGWRRLGHGNATIGLKKIKPGNGGGKKASLEPVKEESPRIAQEVEAIDRAIDRLQVAANRLAGELEEPVRSQFQNDRRKIQDQKDSSVRPFRRWLIDHEDAWMEILANIINDGRTLTESSDPATLYWQYAEPSYRSIPEEYAGAELLCVEQLKSEMTDKMLALLKELETGGI